MELDWSSHETNTHQDHVIAHVLGATILAHFILNEAVYLLLDIGFVWIVYLDGEMGLVPQSMAVSELETDQETKTQLRLEQSKLEHAQIDPGSINLHTIAPDGCLITEVEFQSRAEERRLIITCEQANISIETSLKDREIRVLCA